MAIISCSASPWWLLFIVAQAHGGYDFHVFGTVLMQALGGYNSFLEKYLTNFWLQVCFWLQSPGLFLQRTAKEW